MDNEFLSRAPNEVWSGGGVMEMSGNVGGGKGRPSRSTSVTERDSGLGTRAEYTDAGGVSPSRVLGPASLLERSL